ncbi:MAG: NPCBM/NEW2 domain-containing protein [Armatimonadota bacterium]
MLSLGSHFHYFILLGSIFIISSQPSVGADIKLESNSLGIMNNGHNLPVSLQCPMFEFEKETVGGMHPSLVEGDIGKTGKIILSYPKINLKNGGNLDARVTIEWSGKSKILRKWAKYRVSDAGQQLLSRIVMDTIDTKKQEVWTHGGRAGKANRYAALNTVQSLPFFKEGFFAGIEFPIASNRSDTNGMIEIAHSPGIRLVPGKWYESRRVVYGITQPGDEQSAFERYIIKHGKVIDKLHINYNSWWTTPPPFNEKQVLDVLNQFREHLYEPYRVSFDSFLLDDGWMNSNTIWQIDKNRFPDDFTNVKQAAEKIGSHLGLWMSPSSAYPGSLDNNWAKSQGYETYELPGLAGRLFLCHAAPKYGGEIKKWIPEILKQWDTRLVKTDAIMLYCSESGHGHEPGDLSYERMGESLTEFFNAIRKVNPKVIIEPFGLGYDPSPWWLFYTDEMLTCQGDDAPPARVPSPVGRESNTSARDYFNLQAAALNPSPIRGQEVVGLIHQTRDDFMNDGVTVLLRGHLFFPLYMNPKYMTSQRWENIAGLIKWARCNDGVLKETVPLLPVSWQKGGIPRFTDAGDMPREPYGYAHFTSSKGFVHLRNPWIADQSYKIVLDERIGVSKKASGLSAVSLYPEIRLYGRNLKYGDTLDVDLAAYETLVLSFSKSQPVNGVTPVDSQKTWIQISGNDVKLDRVDFGSSSSLQADSSSPIGDAPSYIRTQIKTDLQISSPEAKLLVLIEGEQDLARPYGLLQVDGKQIEMNVRPSSGIWSSTGLKAREYWTFLEAPLQTGRYPVSVQVFAGNDCKRMSIWVLASKPGGKQAAYLNALPQPENISLGSLCLLSDIDTSQIDSAITEIERPVHKINGIYLDTLEPVSVDQGWGTLQKNRSVWEKPMSIGNRSFIRGLGTHAPSKIVYALDGKYSRFQSCVGGDAAHYPTVTFEVWVDGIKRWESGLMTHDDEAKQVDIDIKGVHKLELITGDGGNGLSGDHADWADAVLLYNNDK